MACRHERVNDVERSFPCRQNGCSMTPSCRTLSFERGAEDIVGARRMKACLAQRIDRDADGIAVADAECLACLHL